MEFIFFHHRLSDFRLLSCGCLSCGCLHCSCCLSCDFRRCSCLSYGLSLRKNLCNYRSRNRFCCSCHSTSCLCCSFPCWNCFCCSFLTSCCGSFLLKRDASCCLADAHILNWSATDGCCWARCRSGGCFDCSDEHCLSSTDGWPRHCPCGHLCLPTDGWWSSDGCLLSGDLSCHSPWDGSCCQEFCR